MRRTMDKNPKRLCTVPDIFNFRHWFEAQYGDLCETHDGAYDTGKCLWCADMAFIGGMVKQDFKYKKKNLLFSVPAAPFVVVAFTGFKIYKKIRGN